ncbi:Numb [Dirofilaria immitis]|nr:Numb [Dirofilaria immitis]
MSPIPSTPSPSAFYRNLWRLTERNKKRKKESLTNSHSISDEAVNDYNSTPQQQQQLSVETSTDAQDVLPPKGNVVHRGMDRIRRSVRESFRRRVPRQHFARRTSSGRQSSPNRSANSSSNKAELWQPDEIAVRNGTCSFTVKYLGGIEVFESRGMQICEGALKLLRGQRRRPIKAVLYISGDGLRVVDQESSRGLIVDQTIEKVSFCAPDRNHDKGFAYICRDGTSRRWMCHGFHALKESVSLTINNQKEVMCVCDLFGKKKKRDAEATAAVQAAAGLPPLGCEKPNGTGFTLDEIRQQKSPIPISSFERNNCNGCFRRLSITERLRDPQTAIVQPPPATSNHPSSSLHITPKPRPIGNPLLLVRQGSLRAPVSSVINTTTFHRQLSLRSFPDSPIKRCQQISATAIGKGEPIFEGDEDKGWLNDGTLNEGSTFENAPYCSVKYNGFRQSLSYTSAPYSNISNNFGGTGTYSLVNSPLQVQVQTNYLSNVSGPESWLSSPISTCPSTAKSKADEWLEQTLRSSLSLNSPCKNTNDLSRTNYTINGPPNHPPPPLPSSTAQSANSETAIRFSSDFSQYELSTITENFSPLSKNAAVPSSLLMESEIDVFGQPVFSSLLSNSQRSPKHDTDEMFRHHNHLKWKAMSGLLSFYHQPLFDQINEYISNGTSEKPEETNPFNVKWSHLAVDVATTYPVPVRSTNPFYSESSAVKI